VSFAGGGAFVFTSTVIESLKKPAPSETSGAGRERRDASLGCERGKITRAVFHCRERNEGKKRKGAEAKLLHLARAVFTRPKAPPPGSTDGKLPDFSLGQTAFVGKKGLECLSPRAMRFFSVRREAPLFLRKESFLAISFALSLSALLLFIHRS